MTAQDQATPIITATIVADDNRLDFFPSNFGKYYQAGEHLLYVMARRFLKDYQGGYWNFYSLSNGGFFAALDTDKAQHFVVADNYFSEHLSAQAAGITLTLFVLGRLLAARIPENEAQRFLDLYSKLLRFAQDHAESQAIMTAID